jgi:type I restriction enzyme R subunit
LTYFDAFIISITATPDKRTFAFFNENVVSEYPREQAIVDGVNVGEDIFIIETEIGKKGGHIMKNVLTVRLTKKASFERENRIVDGHKQTVKYIAGIAI